MRPEFRKRKIADELELSSMLMINSGSGGRRARLTVIAKTAVKLTANAAQRLFTSLMSGGDSWRCG